MKVLCFYLNLDLVVEVGCGSGVISSALRYPTFRTLESKELAHHFRGGGDFLNKGRGGAVAACQHTGFQEKILIMISTFIIF